MSLHRQRITFSKNAFHLLIITVLAVLFLHCVDCRPVLAQTKEISTESLRTLMESDREFALINVLPKVIYDSKHLPGSINIPIGKLAKLEALPFVKDIPLIFYCMGYL